MIMNEKGFTVVEMLVVIAIMIVMLSFTSYGLNVYYNNNIDGLATEFTSDLMDIRYKSVSDYKNEYKLVITYDSTDDIYGYQISKKNKDTSVITIMKTKTFGGSIDLYKNVNGTFQEINSLDPSINPEVVTFKYSNSTMGGFDLTDFDGVTALDDTFSASSLSTDIAEIQFRSARSDFTETIQCIQFTGRVNLNESY